MATPLVLLLLLGLLALAVYMLLQATAAVDKTKPSKIIAKVTDPKEDSSDS